MPRTMQQSIVRMRARSRPRTGEGMLWLRFTMAPMSLEARPVTVMHPATIPAIEQATITVMQLFPPAERDSRIIFPVFFAILPKFFSALRWPGIATRMATAIAIDAEYARLLMLPATSHTRMMMGRSR